MGLDTTHNCFHGPYTSFNSWRNELAKLAGYELASYGQIYQGKLYEGFVAPKIDWSKITDEQAYGEWKRVPQDPLLVLLVHSDCEGVIHPRECRLLAKRLEELMGKMEKSNLPHDVYYTTKRFVEGLRLAEKRGEDVEFL